MLRVTDQVVSTSLIEKKLYVTEQPKLQLLRGNLNAALH